MFFFVVVGAYLCGWLVERVSWKGRGSDFNWEGTADASLLVPLAGANKHQSDGTTAGGTMIAY